MDAYERLRQYRDAYRYAIECAHVVDDARHSQLRSPKYDRVSRSSGMSGLDYTMEKIEAADRKYLKAKKKVLRLLNELADMVDELDDYQEQKVIYLRHIYVMDWTDIGKSMGISDRTAQRIHGRAMTALQHIMKTKEEDLNERTQSKG